MRRGELLAALLGSSLTIRGSSAACLSMTDARVGAMSMCCAVLLSSGLGCQHYVTLPSCCGGARSNAAQGMRAYLLTALCTRPLM